MTKDMTKGPVLPLILSFAFPLWLGNMFQQFYNVVDSVVVGRFVSKGALAAVGASFSLMTFVSAIIIGMCMGCSVIFSRLFGAKDHENLQRSVSTSLILCAGITLVLMVITLGFTDQILHLIQIPADIFADTRLYLKIIFWGLPFVFLQNATANLLRSLGNSKTPLLFLVMACLINVALDLVLVLVFGMGVMGVAVATITAQGISSIGCLVYCLKKLDVCHFAKGQFVFDRSMLTQILSYGSLTALQQSIMTLGILVIQSIVNTFGTTVIAGFTAAVKIEAFAYLPVQDFGNAYATYTAQNKGAGQIPRIKQGLKVCVLTNVVFCALISSLVVLFSRPLMTLFVSAAETQVIAVGMQYLLYVAPFYVLIGFLFMHYAFYRGMGVLNMSVILTIISLGTRIAISYFFSRLYGPVAIWISIPIGWLLADILGFVLIPSTFSKKR